MAESGLYIGLMSGTSIDAVDAVLVRFEDDHFRVIGRHSQPVPQSLRRDILTLCQPPDDNLDLLGGTDLALGRLFADTANQLIARHELSPARIAAIGSHGQTVRHRPPNGKGSHPFSLQIGDPNTIAAITGITTVADFRRKDMAHGGQGAPLAPAFHRAAFHSPQRHRAIVNIGGIANITWLPRTGDIAGFDTGPGNGLMDAWCQRHLGEPYDEDGRWGASSKADESLLAELLRHPFLAFAPPKSTGREDFNLTWLDTVLARRQHSIEAVDVQATLAVFTARTIARGIASLPGEQAEEVYICGGGAYNRHLMDLIAQEMAPVPVAGTSALAIAPEDVEGTAFAWLARQALQRLPAGVAAVTGARQEAVLGGIYFP